MEHKPKFGWKEFCERSREQAGGCEHHVDMEAGKSLPG